jgi:hypothetical protein
MASKTLRALKTTKEIHDTYKTMYEDLDETLIKLQDENKKLQKAVGRLERVISLAYTCRYYGDCPMRDELQRQKADAKPRGRNKSTTNRQREPGGRADHEGDPDPGVEGDDETVV